MFFQPLVMDSVDRERWDVKSCFFLISPLTNNHFAFASTPPLSPESADIAVLLNLFFKIPEKIRNSHLCATCTPVIATKM